MLRIEVYQVHHWYWLLRDGPFIDQYSRSYKSKQAALRGAQRFQKRVSKAKIEIGVYQ